MQSAETLLEGACGSPQVRQYELLCRRFFEVAADAVAITDTDGIVVHFNSHAENLFGYSRHELLNQPIEMLIPERLRVGHGEQRRAYFNDPLPRPMASNFRGVGQRKDGTEFPIDVALSPLLTESGLYVASSIRDMTSYRRLQDELRQRMESLEEAERHTDNFLATLPHELGNPLTAVAYCVEILRHLDTTPEIRADAVKTALEQVKFIRRLLEDLSDLALVRRGGLPLREAPTDLAEVVRVAVDSTRPLIEQHGVALEIVKHSPRIPVRGDATRLVQIVTNLLANAARYTPEEGRIRLSIEQVGGTAVLRVKDNGIGIPKDMLTRVFELFTRLEGAKRRYASGMGIGLAFVRRLVEIHGGTVEAFSEGEGQGSEFVVRLPLLAGSPMTKESVF